MEKNNNDALKEKLILSMICFPFFNMEDLADDCELEIEAVKTFIREMVAKQQIFLRTFKTGFYQLVCIHDKNAVVA